MLCYLVSSFMGWGVKNKKSGHLFNFFIIFFFCSVVKGSNFTDDVIRISNQCDQVLNIFTFCGSDNHRKKFIFYVSEITKTKIGIETYSALLESQKKIVVLHSKYAVNSAGKTLAELTRNLVNGVGTDVVIEMNFDVPKSGSHMVVSTLGDLIPFTFTQNLMHELAHARYKATGFWQWTNSEAQAIVDENKFRYEESLIGASQYRARDLSSMENDVQVWFND